MVNTVRDVLKGLNRTFRVNICDFDEVLLEEGSVAGLLDESKFLDHPAIYTENDFPYLIIVGEAM